jgi:transposase InsO family protein
VSGSSGKLIVERSSQEKVEGWYPGRVFADETLSYEEAMVQFVADSQAKVGDVKTELSPEAAERVRAKAEKAALRRAEEELKVERRQMREHRAQEDSTWRSERAERRRQQEVRESQRIAGVKLPHGSKKARDEVWRYKRQRRRQQLAQRRQEDEQWRQQRREIREQLQRTRVITAWIAILLITDNCTRQCLGLPLFVAGAHVTAETVVEALRVLLPAELQFLISDRGTHFTAKVFQQLAQDEEFIHVLIARHRPQSNGIAERFVRTLKEWLRNKSWQSPPELEMLLFQFLHEYNNRPHQGLPIPISPNEYANRAWLM